MRICAEVRDDITRQPSSAPGARSRSVAGWEDTAVDHRADGGGELERTDRQAVTETDGHGVDLAPRRRRQRGGNLGELDVGGAQQAEAGQEVALRLGADILRHLGGADVGRVDDDFRHREPAVLGLVVADDEARHAQRLAGVVAVGHGDHAGVERHRHGKQLERRAHLVGAQRGPVEARRAGAIARVIGIEVGQRRQRQDLAVVGVDDQPRRADCAEGRHAVRQLLAQHVLEARVERKAQGLGAAAVGAQGVVERFFDPGDATVVDVDEAEHVGEHPAQWVDPQILALKCDAGEAQAVDGRLLARREVALDPDEAAIALELDLERGAADAGQHGGQLGDRLVGVEHQSGIGVDRRGRQVGGEQHAVAVDDVVAVEPSARRRRCPVGEARLQPVADDREVDQAGGDDEVGEHEQRAGEQQTVAAGLEGAVRRALEGDVVAVDRARRAGPAARVNHGDDSTPPRNAARRSSPGAARGGSNAIEPTCPGVIACSAR